MLAHTYTPTDPADASDPGRRGGFTVVEVITVMALIGILSSIVFFRVDRERAQVNSQVQTLAFALNTAQREAVVRQHDVRISFDTSGRRISVHRDENNDGSVQSGETRSNIFLEDDVVFGLVGTDGLPWGTDPVTFDVVGGQPTLVFHRNGSASDLGAVYLSSEKRLAEYNRAVEVERATGPVRCYSYETGSWVATC